MPSLSSCTQLSIGLYSVTVLRYTEPTIMQSKDGKPLNGNLLYTIRPIPGVLEAFYERQFRQMEEDIARQRAEEQLAKAML